jgi:hypothetical protein
MRPFPSYALIDIANYMSVSTNLLFNSQKRCQITLNVAVGLAFFRRRFFLTINAQISLPFIEPLLVQISAWPER